MAHLRKVWSGWMDLNQRQRASKARTLTRLSYTQMNKRQPEITAAGLMPFVGLFSGLPNPGFPRIHSGLPKQRPSHMRWWPFFYAGGDACMRYNYSMLCLPSALPDSEGLRATVRRYIKDRRLGALGLPEFHPEVIQAYATFAVSLRRVFPLSFRLDLNQQPIVLAGIALPMSY